MGLRSGYEHCYHYSMDDEIIPSYIEPFISWYKEALDLEIQVKVFILEIRTNFVLKRRLDDDDDNDDEIMDSESLAVTVCVHVDQHDDWLERLCRRVHRRVGQIIYRLNEYLMPDDEIQSLIDGAFDFAKQIVAVDSSQRAVVPVVVGVDVCTVRLEGEPLDNAIDRSIRPDCLIPLHLLRPKDSCRLRDFLLFRLPKIRVEDVDQGFALMEEACPICLRGPTIAAPISLLPCNHAFHSHCVVRWLLKSESCPLCRHKIVLEKEDDKGTK